MRLIYGIGPSHETQLRDEGYQSIYDLAKHPKWGRPSQQLIQTIESRNARAIQVHIHRWFPVSHPISSQLVSLFEQKQLRFFDIESLGLFGRPGIMFGSGRIDESGLEIRQIFVRDIAEELPALLAIAEELGEEPALVTYNGRAFDCNFLEERWGYYGIPQPFEPVHFDLLHVARRKFRDVLPNAKLETVERHYGVTREIDLPGALVPDFYNSYLETNNIGPLLPIIEHNKQDLISLALLLSEFSR